MPTSEMDSVSAQELEALMKEFPDWKDQHPDLYAQINPPRYSKINRKGRVDPTQSVAKKRAGSVPVSHYKGTFQAAPQRPRSTKRPPPSPRDPNPPPMSFVTNQRSDFVPKDLNARGKLVKMEENYHPSSAPLEGTTHYKRDYPGHFVLPDIRRSPVQASQKKNSAKMADQTTTKEHYRAWKAEPSLTFGELPAFTGSILYPEPGMSLTTTTGVTFRGAPGKKSDLIHQAEGNIKLEGDHDMNTTHSLTFKKRQGAPAKKVVHQGQVRVNQRAKFNGETQFMRDFASFGPHGQPLPPKPVDPAPSTIDLKFDNRTSFETEQQKQFQGIDCRIHPVAKSYKVNEKGYQPPTVKFESNTSQKLDYKPIEVQNVFVAPVKPPQSHKMNSEAKFDDCTMNKQFFKKWEVEPRVRYGDFHEAHTYIPPADRFSATTTTGDTFVTKKAEVPHSYKPEQSAVAREGDYDFNTSYKVTFQQPNPLKNLDKKQAAQLLKELRQRKALASKCPQTKRHTVAAK